MSLPVKDLSVRFVNPTEQEVYFPESLRAYRVVKDDLDLGTLLAHAAYVAERHQKPVIVSFGVAQGGLIAKGYWRAELEESAKYARANASNAGALVYRVTPDRKVTRFDVINPIHYVSFRSDSHLPLRLRVFLGEIQKGRRSQRISRRDETKMRSAGYPDELIKLSKQ